MLSAIENRLMSFLYKTCKSKESVLISIEELMNVMPQKQHVTLSEVEKMMQNLIYDGYLDVVATNKKGKHYYCVTLKGKGKAFPRERESQIRDIKRRAVLMVVFSIGSFLIGVILKAIFF